MIRYRQQQLFPQILSSRRPFTIELPGTGDTTHPFFCSSSGSGFSFHLRTEHRRPTAECAGSRRALYTRRRWENFSDGIPTTLTSFPSRCPAASSTSRRCHKPTQHFYSSMQVIIFFCHPPNVILEPRSGAAVRGWQEKTNKPHAQLAELSLHHLVYSLVVLRALPGRRHWCSLARCSSSRGRRFGGTVRFRIIESLEPHQRTVPPPMYVDRQQNCSSLLVARNFGLR